MLECYRIHDGSNLSFHSPLVLTLNLEINIVHLSLEGKDLDLTGKKGRTVT